MTTSYQPRVLPFRPVAGAAAAIAVVAGLVLWSDSAFTGSDASGLPFDGAALAPIAAAPAVDAAAPVGFGTAHTWSDGAAIAISAPASFASPSAFAPTGLARAVSVQVTLTAGATEFDPTTLRFDAMAASQPAGAVFDTGSGIAPVPVPAGSSADYQLLFAIPVEESTQFAIRVDRTLGTGTESVTVAGLS